MGVVDVVSVAAVAPMAVVVLWGWPSTFIMDCVSPTGCLVGDVSGVVGVGMFATWVVSAGFGVVGIVGGVDGAGSVGRYCGHWLAWTLWASLAAPMVLVVAPMWASWAALMALAGPVGLAADDISLGGDAISSVGGMAAVSGGVRAWCECGWGACKGSLRVRCCCVAASVQCCVALYWCSGVKS